MKFGMMKKNSEKWGRKGEKGGGAMGDFL